MKILLLAALALLPSLQQPPAPKLVTDQEAQQMIQRGEFDAVIVAMRARVAANDKDYQAWFSLGYSLHVQGKLEEALAAHVRAAESKDGSGTAPTGAYNAACAHALLGHPDEAFEWLDKAMKAGFSQLDMIRTDTDLVSLRSDPRFAKLFGPAVLTGKELFAEPTRVIYSIDGEAAGDEFGWVGRPIGDVDKDGVQDFATTAPSHANSKGRVYVHSGKSGKRLFVFEGTPGARLGDSVAGGGDVNGDGTPDVLTGATGASRVFVYSGVDGALLHELAGDAGSAFGLKTCALEDLDGDGCAEIAVGAWKEAGAAGPAAGAVHVFSGKSGARLFRLEGATAGEQFGSALDGTRSGGHHLLAIGACKSKGAGRVAVFRCTVDGAEPAFEIAASDTGRHMGQYFVSMLGDVNADGVPDVFASDWDDAVKGPSTGRVVVCSGADGAVLLDLSGRVAGEGFGTSASVAGDANGDGRADLIVGAWQNSEKAKAGGKCYLLSGADGSTLATWTCKQAGDTFGFDAMGLGDVDGDGGVDYLLTSAWSAVSGPKTGRVFVVAGPVFGAEAE